MQELATNRFSEFDRKLIVFGMAALAVTQAQYLLDEQNGFKLSKVKRQQIVREHVFAELNLKHCFDEIRDMGIPDHMLPRDLLVRRRKK